MAPPTAPPTSGRYAVVLTDRLDEYRLGLAAGMLPILAEQGISLLVHAEDPFAPGLSATVAELFRLSPPVGVIATEGAVGTYGGELFDLLSELAIPVISIAMAGMGQVDVRAEDTAAVLDLMAHLLDERGVRRPVLIRGTVGQKDSLDREYLVRHELSRRGLSLDEELVINGDFAVDTAYSSMRDLLSRRRDMDAVIAGNDLSAMGAWRALAQAGLRVPDDVLLSGCDNEQIARINWPGLTTIDNDLAGQGRAAARSLVAELAGEPLGATEITLPGRLVVRGSTGTNDGTSSAGMLERAVAMARASQRQLAEQDELLAFTQAMMRCATIPELIDALTTHLERLGVSRCLLAMYELATEDGDRRAPGSGRVTGTRVLLDHWDGTARPVPSGPVGVHPLLRHDPDRGILAFQPLSTADRPLGYLLFEPTPGIGTLPETLRIDLSRSLGAVLSAQDLSRYALTLRARVEQRTRELKQEVSTRRRTEAELHRLNAGLQRSLMIDGLTGIANRAAFERHFDLHGPAGIEGDEIALLFVDVDHFKAYNDLYGHVMGDEALRQVAGSLARALRYPQDLACRWGGEEFAALLPGSGQAGARMVAARFRRLLARRDIRHDGSGVCDRLTVSVGIALATAGPGLTAAEFVEEADRALYAAKMLGRNCVYPPATVRPVRRPGADPVSTPASGSEI